MTKSKDLKSVFVKGQTSRPHNSNGNRSSDWWSSPPAVRRCGKNRSRFYLPAERAARSRKRRCGRLRLRKVLWPVHTVTEK